MVSAALILEERGAVWEGVEARCRASRRDTGCVVTPVEVYAVEAPGG